ncbi:hypothetical protein Mgra_00006913 [Meloidogyne graminicola]|uniref:Uncharacterized protein n=1 Tax=Meloidogyne graminicola TaxID=189291 RepID=A0A8S9ZKR8_9BILA|nr:hypothetical protein Mgra_00006913 [Meloidogyne graminicola]
MTSASSPPPSKTTIGLISTLNFNYFSDNTSEAQMAARVLFELIHNYGDNLREGWKNVLDCLLYLLRANLLPSKLLQLEDFVDSRGIISIKEKFKRPPILPKKEESGLFSWLGLSVSSISSETDTNKHQTSEEEQELCKSAISLIAECHPEQLITDSRYLTTSAFTELINNIIHCSFSLAPIQQKSHLIDSHIDQCNNQQNYESQRSQSQDDDSIVDLTSAASALLSEKQQIKEDIRGDAKNKHEEHLQQYQFIFEEEEDLVFLLELLVRVRILLQNCDRLDQVWPKIIDYLRWLFNDYFSQSNLIAERTIVSITRIAISIETKTTTELWSKYWKPLIQAIARMCCDCRRLIRKQALEALGVIKK